VAEQPPEVMWTPDPATAEASGLAQFGRWSGHGGADGMDYAALHWWSVADPSAFWGCVAEFFGVRFHEPPTAVLGSAEMPGAQWFPGATLNYAEHVLTVAPGRADDDVAVIFNREDGVDWMLTHGELRSAAAAARAGLVALGVGRGDRVVALAPNCLETLVCFLATASLGAIWSSCSPDFGARAVQNRFAQIEPSVLIAVDGYVYGGKRHDVTSTVAALRDQLPTLRATVLIPYLKWDDADPAVTLPGTLPWSEFLGTPDASTLAFEPVPFDHPLWVLYSSGTTGLPKGIVHGHGGIVLEHMKVLRLHCDLGPGDRFFWFTTTGWMMWNFLIGGLLVGSTIVLYDGNPGHPDLETLWRLAERHRITYLGVSAPFVHACLKAGLRPRDFADLGDLRTIGSTGAPLSTDGFRWIADAVGERVQIASVSGGTDTCTAFVGAAPTLPVWLGEISGPTLGSAVAAFDEDGHPVVDEVGELVITEAMPSMPVSFWNDPDGSRLRAAYYEDFPGVWRHGDWIKITPRGSCVIYGRSDSTLNRGGVRMGTSEFYAVVEGFDEVADSLVIDTTALGATTEGELLCFLVLAPGASLAEVEPELRAALRAELSPRHVPNRFVVVDAVPRTLNGKKCEVPVKKILAGVEVNKVISREALANPESLAPFLELAAAAAAE
jgi:acetoacetyl-CoA synthetase